MNIQQALLLTSIFMLPTQVLSAENTRDSTQTRANQSVVKSQANATSQLKKTIPVNQGNVSADPAAKLGPATVKKQTLPSREMVTARQGPNLTVSIRYEHDVCAVDESPLGENIYDARCDLIITVKNVGDTATSLPATGAFKLNLWYINYNGEVKKGFRYISNLGVNEEKVITYRSSSLRSFKRSTPFTAQVDKSNTVKESNERDNNTVFWLN